MSRWAWLEPEHRADVLGLLASELQSSRLQTFAYGRLEHAPTVVENGRVVRRAPPHAHDLAVFYRLRAQWLEAAIEELGGEVPEPDPRLEP